MSHIYIRLADGRDVVYSGDVEVQIPHPKKPCPCPCCADGQPRRFHNLTGDCATCRWADVCQDHIQTREAQG